MRHDYASSMLFVVASLLPSCAAKRPGAAADVKALVSPDQFGRAMAAVEATRSYVPYADPITCDARATWIAALLASESIPSTKRYLFAPSNTEKLRGPGNVGWDFHVAVMIRASDSSENMILDPTWGQDWLKVDWRWREQMTTNPDAYQLDVPGSTDGVEIRYNYRSIPNNVVQSYEAMPKFKMALVEKACGTLSQYQTTVTGLDYPAAQTKLKSEMLRIADALAQQGKLDWGALTPGVVYCGSEKLR